jgi:hypothetical protein
MSYLDELKRRNVIRSIAAYLALSWLIIQVAETVMPLFELGAGAVRAVVIVLAVGIVPVAALAWRFELTPAGIKRDREVDRDAPGMRELGRRLDRVFLLVLAVAVGYFAIDKFVLDPARDRAREEVAEQRGRSSALLESYGTKSIAVLPFVNMSSDPEQEYFSDGIAEEVLNLLARISELRVISRSSSFTFKDQDLPMPEIARQPERRSHPRRQRAQVRPQDSRDGAADRNSNRYPSLVAGLRPRARRYLRHPGRDRCRCRRQSEAHPARRTADGATDRS